MLIKFNREITVNVITQVSETFKKDQILEIDELDQNETEIDVQLGDGSTCTLEKQDYQVIEE
jgi:hypothetical protein